MTQRCLLIVRSLNVPITHLATANDQVDEHAEKWHEDDRDRPDRLHQAYEIVASEDVGENRDDEHYPHQEQEEPEDRPEHLADLEFGKNHDYTIP